MTAQELGVKYFTDRMNFITKELGRDPTPEEIARHVVGACGVAADAERAAWLRAAVVDKSTSGSWKDTGWPWYCTLNDSRYETREAAESAALELINNN